MAHVCPDRWLTPHRTGGSAASEYPLIQSKGKQIGIAERRDKDMEKQNIYAYAGLVWFLCCVFQLKNENMFYSMLLPELGSESIAYSILLYLLNSI